MVIYIGLWLVLTSLSCGKNTFTGGDSKNKPQEVVKAPEPIPASRPIAEPEIDAATDRKEISEVPQPPVDTEIQIVTSDQVIEACNGTREQSIQQLNFPERSDSCDFGNNGNNPKSDKKFQAYAVTTQEISLPEGALLCSVSLESQQTDLRYDDTLFFTADKYVVTSSHKTMVDLLPFDPIAQLVSWDFEKLKGQDVDFGEDKLDFCTTNANCLIPPHDQTGPFKLVLETNEVAPLVIALNGKQNIPFSVITGGDDNDSDCTHSAFNLVANLTYVLSSSPTSP